MAGANTVTFTDATWDKDVLNSDVPVLVDFWAEWCGPCRMMSPTIDAIAGDYAGRVKVGKLNVDENGATGMRYNVRGIPTLLLFKGGQVVAQKVGATGKADLQKMIDPHVQASAGSVPASSTVTPSSNGAATTPSKDAATPATKDDVRVA